MGHFAAGILRACAGSVRVEMEYRNVITGAVISVTSQIRGENWRKIREAKSVSRAPGKRKKAGDPDGGQ